MAPSTRTACFARVTAANFCFFLQGFVYPTLNAFTIDLAEPGQLGRTQTLYNGAFNLGTTAGSMALGLVAHTFGHRVMFLVAAGGSEEHTSELQSRPHLVCRLLLEKKKKKRTKQARVRITK